MNYGQDFVNADFGAVAVFGGILGGLSFGPVMALLMFLKKKDSETCLSINRREYLRWMIVCILSGVHIMCKYRNDRVNVCIGFLMLIYLVLCCITDYHTQMVYDIIQVGMCMLLVPIILWKAPEPVMGVELIVFGGIQIGLFRRMYGDADVMGFLICALSLVDGGMLMWTIHMAITFLLLGIAQGWRRNIASDGNLKVSVPLYPYIAVAYLFVF